MSLPNINEQAVLLSVTSSSQNITLPFTPDALLVTNSGTGTAYVRAATSASDTISVPTAGTFGSWIEVLPGHAQSMSWATTFSTKNLLYISPTTTTLTVKMTRSKQNAGV